MPAYLDTVLTELKKSRGIDLSGYRRGTLERRLAARMARLRCDDPNEYLARLESDPNECNHLIDAIAINVSAFFRNPVIWEILRQTVVPEIIERKRRGGKNEIRAWSAGCAAGEEAYSVAMLVHQALKDELADWRPHIFATDIDSNALSTATRAIYPRESFADTKLGVLDQYFAATDGGYELRPFVRQMVWFSADDLASPSGFAPKQSIFGAFDLVFCRNVLIYFSVELQDAVLDKLVRSLDRGGYLILGESESLNSKVQAQLAEVDGRNRIYRKYE